jgi:hypothetical protein
MWTCRRCDSEVRGHEFCPHCDHDKNRTQESLSPVDGVRHPQDGDGPGRRLGHPVPR